MLLADLLHSCRNERVAAAAIASIGGEFEALLRSEADNRGVSAGALAAGLVGSFAQDAGERDWRDLAHAVRRQDFPVLAGLQVVVARRLRDRPAGREHGPRTDAAVIEVWC